MMNEFEMKDLSLMKYFLGTQVYQGKDQILNFQKKYVKYTLKKFFMADYKTLSTPISHGVTLCRDDGTKIVDETSYKIIVGDFTFLSHIRPDTCNQLQPYNKTFFRTVVGGPF